MRDLQIAVACLRYVRDIVLITAGGGDLIEALVFTAALDANMVPVDRDAHLRVVYGGAEASAPDDLRRPVSVNGVAQSLGLPFETVRRRFVGLVHRGDCVAVAGGVVVPRSAVTSTAYKAIQQSRYQRTQDLYETLKALRVVAEPSTDQEEPAEPLVRAANRAASEYMLRACPALVSLTGNVLTSLVLLQLALENTRQMDQARLATWARDAGMSGRPVRIISLSGQLPLSRETVRRHVRALEALGLCRRVAGGFVAIAPARAQRELADLARSNEADLRRLFAKLGRLGVLAAWDASAAPAHPS